MVNSFGQAEPFSSKDIGELIKYLEETCVFRSFDNLFFGPEYFFVMRDNGLLVPNTSYIRVNMSPAPDRGYFVNKDFVLESKGEGEINMSFIGAPRGVYDPKKSLAKRYWSVYGLCAEKLVQR